MKKHLPKLISLLILSVSLLTNVAFSQNCPNADFTMGNFTNWVGTTGTYNTPQTFNLTVPGIITPAYHNIMAVPGIDPNTAGGLQFIPPGYTVSARLNSQPNTGGAASQLSYSMVVDPTNALFIYNYAVVLNDGGHTPDQQPKFEIMVMDQFNNIIPCTYYEVAAGLGIPGFQTVGSVQWKDWEKVGVDLTAYMGQTVTIRARVAGCVQEQGAHFGYAYLTGECSPLEILVQYCQGDTVATLTAPDGFSNYAWSTGETTQSIVITNPIPGATNITCTITSVTGCVAVLNALVNPVITTAGFTFADNCGLVQFTDTSTCTGTGNTINQWSWDFDDAGATSTLQNPSHQYPNSGGYNVTLIATSTAGCSDTAIVNVPVAGLPTANFTTPTGCGLTNTFSDNGSLGGSSAITNFDWDFGDLNTGAGTPVNHTYAVSGTWNIQLVVTNADGCTDTLVQPFTNRNIPTAGFNVADVCPYDTAHFIDQSVVANANVIDWDWTVEPGVNINNTQNPDHLYNGAPGVYNVQLIITTDEGCLDTIVQPINIWPVPNPAYTVTEVCLGDFSVYNNTSNISSGAIVDYTWDFGDPLLPDNGLQNPQIEYNTDGLYNTQLIATSDHGCVDTATRSFNVWPMPNIDFTAGPLEGCYPFTVMFDNLTTINSGTVNYTWDLDDGNPVVSGFEPSIMYPNMENTYSITLYAVSDHGCDTSFTRPNYITVHPKPTASFTYTPTDLDVIHNVCRTINLSVLGDSYYWDFGNGATSTNFEDYVEYPDTGYYTMTLVTTTNFGCVDTAQAIVYVKPTFTIYIPNSFTPNEDGMNDFFMVYGYNLTDVTMRIFDRWGENLITMSGTDPVTKGWNGIYKELPAKQDVYVYRVEVIDIFGDYHEFIGQINLLR